MKIRTSIAAFALLVALSPAGIAQQFQPSQPSSSSGVAAEMSPAVVWTETQTPQPAPAEKAVPAPDKQQDQRPPDNPTAIPAQTSPMQNASESATKTFTGTVVRIGDKYVLRTTDNMAYQLDDPDKAKEFEGKQVKVTGGLQAKDKLIHIQSIEAAP